MSKNRSLGIALAAWLLTGQVFAASQAESHQTFSLFKIRSQDKAALGDIADRYEIVGRKGTIYDIYVPANQAPNFQKEHPEARLIQSDADADWRPLIKSENKVANGYHDFTAVQEFMTSAAQTYPNLASVHSYGSTSQGRPLNYLLLSAPVQSEASAAKPKIFLDAATHGDELISTEVLLTLTGELLRGYGNDERLTKILDQSDIYISFVVNPDGFVNQNRYEGWVDPNRSYPWPGDPSKQATPSIQALMKLFDEQRFEGSMTFHAYGKLLMYPWGYTSSPIEDGEDRASFESLTDSLALTNNYTHGPIATTIYVAKGSSADYYYWKYGTRALAVELSTSKVPQASRIPSVVDEAREMVWAFLESFGH